MMEEIRVLVDDRYVTMSKNIIIYATDDEMIQLRSILSHIAKRYKEKKGHQISCNLSNGNKQNK